MIERVEIHDPNRTPVKWWPDVEHLQTFTEFQFTPGINIIWGPNGSGKSTLLTAIAHLTHSKQSGRSVVTRSSLRVINGRIGSRHSILDGMQLHYDDDGRTSVLYYSPLDSIGLIGGEFDNDFFKEGFQSICHNKISSGQSANAKLGEVLKHQGKEIQWKYKPRKEDPLIKAIEFTKENLSSPSSPPPRSDVDNDEGLQQTILMDEPDAHLDWTSKLALWYNIQRAATMAKFQFIVATHSPFGLRCPGANFIDLQKDYRFECEAALQLGGLWS